MMSWKMLRPLHIIILSLSLVSAWNSFAQPGPLNTTTASSATNLTENPKAKKFSGTWNLRLQGRRFEDAYNQKSLVDFAVLAKLNYKPLENLNINLSPTFRYLSGYAQTETETNTNQSQWTVRNASADLQLGGIFEASAGALDQERVVHPILIDEMAFPAARMTLNTAPENGVQVGLQGETAVATSSSLTTQTKEFEKTPTLNTAGLFLVTKSAYIEADLKALLWQFENLPISLATKSGLAGNTTDSVSGGTETAFRYQYKGYESHGKFKVKFNNRIAVGLNGAWVKNNEAPAGLNQGTWSRAFLDYFVNRNWMLTPDYEFFRIESDAAVAGYASTDHYTNAVGYRTGLAVEYKRTVRISIHGGEKDVLVINPNQQRERYWNVKLETLDVAI